jgi:protein-tyrosine phosphatase
MRTSLLCALFLASPAGTASAGEIDRAVLEQTGADTYVLSLAAVKPAYPVRVFRIPRPGAAPEPKELARTSEPRLEVRLPAASGQPFLLLKPGKGKAQVVSIRRLPLEGAPNFRDLGGYRTGDGRHVRWGTVYRSGQLSALTDADFHYLSALRLRLVCDFRVDSERQRAATKWKGDAAPEIVPASIDTVGYYKPGTDIREHMRNVYNRMPFDGSGEYAALFRRMIDGDLPVLLHCTSGKDRTGFFAALLLTILGVPHETVVEDFLLTNRYLVPDERIPQFAREMQERQKLPSLPDAETVRAASGVLASNLEIGFSVIREKYGSVDNYARKALRLSPADVRKLRARLLE